jgi:D-arginine dehydrogenase
VPSIARVDAAAALARVPILRAEYVADAFLEPGSQELDVDGLLQGFLRGAKRRGAQLVLGTAVERIERANGSWLVTTQRGSWRAKILVNAAGAWADTIAASAGLRPLGLQPKRRTAFTIPMPAEIRMTDWPLVNDVAEQFYFKPDAGRLFVSPADATPSPPVDAHPEDLDVAEGVMRLERATTLDVRQVSRSWAGLRTFAPDGKPIVGPDPDCDAFIWLAGQGGSGIKTSPALSRACASWIQNGELPQDFARLGMGAEDLSPARAALESVRGVRVAGRPERSESVVAVSR